MTDIEPNVIAVLHLQPNDIVFVNDEAIDPSMLTGAFKCPVIRVHCRPGMTVTDELAVIRNET
jgi:hypothetical protein